MRRLERVVQRPKVCFGVQRDGLLCCPGGRTGKKWRTQPRLQVGRKDVQARDARQVPDVVNADLTAGILQRIGKPARGILIESAQQLEAGTVVDVAEAAADHGLFRVAKDLLPPLARWPK